jgi:hypothetical protein
MRNSDSKTFSLFDSIVARRWHATDFFNSIDPELS